MYKNSIITILSEVKAVLEKVSDEQIASFVKEIVTANTIVVCGAGRVGYATRGLGMRLGHLGFKAYTLGDSTVPSIGDGDLLIVASGSGETQTIYDVADTGKRNGARIAVITGMPESRIGRIADCLILMKAPSKVNEVQGIKSIQPMSTLNEQCLQLLFDAIVLELMEITGQTHHDMWKRHSNLE
jgi:6-phospho-3-hexuloisomerase